MPLVTIFYEAPRENSQLRTSTFGAAGERADVVEFEVLVVEMSGTLSLNAADIGGYIAGENGHHVASFDCRACHDGTVPDARCDRYKAARGQLSPQHNRLVGLERPRLPHQVADVRLAPDNYQPSRLPERN